MIATSHITIDLRQAEQGFTLIELLVVLSIMALLSTVAISSFSRTARWHRRQEITLLRDAISRAQTKSIRTGQVVVLESAATPSGMRFATSDGQAPRWFPDGTALPAQLSRDRHIILKINPMTGLAQETP